MKDLKPIEATLKWSIALIISLIATGAYAQQYRWSNFAGMPGGIGNVDGTGTAARFYDPWGVAVDGSGNVYIADTMNNAIRKMTPTGAVTTLAGDPWNGGVGWADGTGSAAEFYWPTGVAVDGSGNLYVADSGNNIIRKVTPGGIVTTLAGSPRSYGSADGTGNAATFNDPKGVAVDGSGNVYVADSVNNTIRKVTPGGIVTTLAGSPRATGTADGTGSAARFNWPGGVAVDGSGNVYVADNFGSTIRKVTPGGAVTTSAAYFFESSGVAVDGNGNVYVANPYAILKMTPAGAVTTLSGSVGITGTADGTGIAAQFNGPAGVAVDGSGNLYVADSGNNTIRKVTPAGAVTTLAGNLGVTGTADATGSAARFNGPMGVAVDGSGNSYVADSGNNTIRKVTPAGAVATLAGSPGITGTADGTGSNAQFYAPDGVAVDESGNVYVADRVNNTIRKVTPAGAVTTLAGSPRATGTADGTGSAARFNWPEGVAVDGSGNLYVADCQNNTIRKVTSGGVVTTLAGSPGVQGSADGTGSAARFCEPGGVAVDGSGNLYVADLPNGLIRKVTPAGVVTTLAGGAGNCISVDGTGSTAQFCEPLGVAVDGSGNVYVTDGDYTIRKVTPGGVVTTIGGTPWVRGGVDGLGMAALFSNPSGGIAASSNGTLYVADSGNNRISQGVLATFVAPTVATGSPTGTTYNSTTLNGTVNPNGLATSVYFEYGTTLAYGSTTGTQAAGSGTGTIPCNAQIGILASGTYHYCLVGINASGTSYGSDQKFIVMPSYDANLSMLRLSAGALSPTFSGTGTSYTVNVDNGVASTTVTATMETSGSLQMSLNDGTFSSLKSGKTSGPLKLQVGVNLIDIVVTAPDRSTTETYSVTVNRAALPGAAAVQSGTTVGIANSKFVSFGNPAVNDSGDVAFQAVVSGTAAKSTGYSAIFVESGSTGAIGEVASTSGTLAAAPDESGTGQIGSFAALGDPVFNNAGEVAFLGTVKSSGSLKVTSANDQGIWAKTTGALRLVAREGQTLASSGSLTGAKFASFSQLALPDNGGPVFLATLALQPGKVTAKNNQGVWGTGSDGALELLVGTGQPLASGTSAVASLSIFSAPAGVAGQTRSFNAEGALILAATFADKTQGVFTMASNGTVYPVCRIHDAAPIASGPATATFAAFDSPIINDARNAAFQATITGSGVTAANKTGIWSESGTAGPLALVARLGVPAFYTQETGTVSAIVTGTFTALGDPVLNANDQVAFIGTVKTGTGRTVASSQGIWMTATTGGLVQVIQAQDPAPGCATGAKFSGFTQLALPNQGGAVFVANLVTGAGGVTAAANQGIWAVDTTGLLTLVACKGDVLNNGKTIATLSIFNSSVGTTGQTRSFNSAGDLVYKVTFTDGTQGIYKVVFP